MFQLLRRVVASQCPYSSTYASRPLTTTSSSLAKNMPPRPKPPPDSEIEESYLKGSGPGGQKINKTNSAVQLKHIPTGIVVKSQATRSREQNRKHARELLAQKVDDLRHGEQSRSAIVGGVRKKRADSAAKKSRRKYRLLEEAKAKETHSDNAESDGASAAIDVEAEAANMPTSLPNTSTELNKSQATDAGIATDRQKQ